MEPSSVELLLVEDNPHDLTLALHALNRHQPPDAEAGDPAAVSHGLEDERRDRR